ncbi:hypothetical protein [Rhodoferax sp. GW822-FHT02A01]|uniref:hypothetical protein n=1 Tax=Rhodoferax sp. GW822-FHT02A01 TaxID=3141537 RepID=UPI00315C6BB5
MKQQWQELLARVDALSLRERVFLFLSVFVCVLAGADFFWFTPATVAHRQLLQRFSAQSAELDRLRNELRVSGVPSDPSKDARDELQSAKARVQELNAQITALAPTDTKGPALELVLQRLLRRQDGLTLVSLDTMQSANASGSNGAAASASAANAGDAAVSKRGLVLKVTGPYGELVKYVQALESALPGLRWGTMELKTDKRGNELTLRVYAVGVQL